jgi:hypothetical protein
MALVGCVGSRMCSTDDEKHDCHLSYLTQSFIVALEWRLLEYRHRVVALFNKQRHALVVGDQLLWYCSNVLLPIDMFSWSVVGVDSELHDVVGGGVPLIFP